MIGFESAGRHARGVLTVLLGLLIVSPLARDASWDSFPISSYPMFSRGDLGSVRQLVHARLIDAAGESRPAPPSLIGSTEPMVAQSILVSHMRQGSTADLCAGIAQRIRASKRQGVVAVEILLSTFDARRYFTREDPQSPGDERAPLAREVLARCDVTAAAGDEGT